MSSLRWCCVVLVGCFVCLSPAGAQPEKKQPEPKEPPWHFERKLLLSPRPVQPPVLHYRLYPLSSERKPGNAAPIYLRFAQERTEQMKRELADNCHRWLEMPLDDLPRKEVRQFLDKHRYTLNQMDLAARRQSCDWNYTLDVQDVFSILLPDAQDLRLYSRLLAVKARLEVLEGKYPQAVRTLETGLSFSRQLAEGPFLINVLVGMGMAGTMTDALFELVSRPDAPNLYWSLTALPRPLIDFRHGLETEQVLLEKQMPDLADLERPRTPEEWDAALSRVRKEIERLVKAMILEFGLAAGLGSQPAPPVGEKPPPPPGIGDFLTWVQAVPQARKYLMDRRGLTEKQVDAMPRSQVLLLFLAGSYREMRDDHFKAAYLPYPEARPLLLEANQRLKEQAPRTIGEMVVRELLPGLKKFLLYQARLDRKVAALRLVEAIRLHAAATGKLPDTLEEIRLVPVPLDPTTGKPFQYESNGDTVTIVSRVPGETVEVAGLRIRVSLRKMTR